MLSKFQIAHGYNESVHRHWFKFGPRAPDRKEASGERIPRYFCMPRRSQDHANTPQAERGIRQVEF